YQLWAEHGIETPGQDWLVDQVVSFADAVRRLLEALAEHRPFAQVRTTHSQPMLAHFHEWLRRAAPRRAPASRAPPPPPPPPPPPRPRPPPPPARAPPPPPPPPAPPGGPGPAATTSRPSTRSSAPAPTAPTSLPPSLPSPPRSAT